VTEQHLEDLKVKLAPLGFCTLQWLTEDKAIQCQMAAEITGAVNNNSFVIGLTSLHYRDPTVNIAPGPEVTALGTVQVNSPTAQMLSSGFDIRLSDNLITLVSDSTTFWGFPLNQMLIRHDIQTGKGSLEGTGSTNADRLSSLITSNLPGANIDSGKLDIKFSSDWDLGLPLEEGLNFEGSVDLANVGADYKQYQVELLGTITAQIQNGDINLVAKNFELSGLAIGELQLRHNLSTNLGSFSASINEDIKQFTPLLKMAKLKKLSLLTGQFTGDVVLKWDISDNTHNLEKAITDARIKLLLDKVDLDFDSYQVREQTGGITLSGWPEMKTEQKADLTIATINIGLPIEAIALSYDVTLNPLSGDLQIQGHNLTAEVLGGTATSTDYWYQTSDQGEGMLNLTVEKLAMDQILNLGRDDFDSSGHISGSVPVQITAGKLQIKHGYISAINPGGFIRYTPDESLKGAITTNTQMKLVVDTLADFQYHSLDAELTYSPEGDLVARTALKGSNPAVENGRPIHLNIQVEENLGTLLEGLRMSESLNKGIESRVRQ